MSDYRDTVREMMRDLKANKGPPASVVVAPEVAVPSAVVVDVPNEEDLLDDILDLQEGAPVPMDEDEANELLKSDSEDSPNAGKDYIVYVEK